MLYKFDSRYITLSVPIFLTNSKVWLDKINRLGMDPFLPLILVFLQSETTDARRLAFLKAVERHLFVISLLTRYFPRPPISPQDLQLLVMQLS